MSEFHAEAPQATVSEGLAQGLYVAARARFKPSILLTKGDESVNDPLRTTSHVGRNVGNHETDDIIFH